MKLRTTLLFDENDSADDNAAVTINGKKHNAENNSHVFDVADGGKFLLVNDDGAKKAKGKT